MEAKELRIGNFITGVYENEELGFVEVKCRVLALDETGGMLDYKIWVESLGDSDAEYFEAFNPIQLTEEWLIKFGFGKYSSIQFDRDDFWNIEEPMIRNKGYWCSHLEMHIKTVHQLQNLYFALTGKELEIK